MKVQFIYKDHRGDFEDAHNTESDMDQAEVFALINAASIKYPKKVSSGSTSVIVKIEATQFSVFDNNVLKVVVREYPKESAGTFFY